MKIRDLIKFNIDPVEIQSYLEKLQKEESIVTVAGEFSSGKSTFLNALMGKKKFLPEALKECTPVLIDLVKSNSKQMGIIYQDGSTEEMDMSPDSIERYARYTKDYDENIRMISVPVDSEFIPENVHFVDTPGSNTMIKQHEDIANYVIRKSDVVLYVVNKSFNESDFTRLKYIQKYTEDIVVILTHMDEAQISQSQEGIQRFIQEARANLKDKLGLENLEIYPVGSVQAFHDDTYIAPIRACIQAYIEENTLSMMKKRVEQQLSQIFDRKLDELKQQTDLLIIGMEGEQADIVEKVKTFEKKMNRLDENKRVRASRFRELADEQKTQLHQELALLIDEQKASALNQLLKLNATQVEIDQILASVNEAISHELVQKTEKKIKFLLEMSYQEMNEQLQELLKGINHQANIEIVPPNLDELDFEVDESKVVRLHKAKETHEKYLQEVEQEISAASEQSKELMERKHDYERQLQEITKQMWSLGDLQSEFIEKKVPGGGEAGSKFGRIFGEIADVALIFYNPAGGAVAAADTVKDAAKIGSLLNKASQGKKAVEQAKKMKEVVDKVQKVKSTLDKAKKGKEAIDKLIVKRNEAMEELEEYKESLPENKQKSVLDLLEYLSLGFWGEKIGNAIGNQIKPPSTVYEENEEKRKEWESARETIRQSMLELKMSIESTEREIDQAHSIADKRRLKQQLQEKIERQQELVEENQRKLEQEKAFNVQKEVEMYYQHQIDKLFAAELKNMNLEVDATMNYAIDAIERNNQQQFDHEIKKMKELVQDLQKSKEELSQNVEANKMQLEELSNYPSWIEEWVGQSGDR